VNTATHVSTHTGIVSTRFDLEKIGSDLGMKNVDHSLRETAPAEETDQRVLAFDERHVSSQFSIGTPSEQFTFLVGRVNSERLHYLLSF
jgi:hypothetical protein